MISQIKQKGFTIVELLIVIVVIAILAAISMAAYTSISARAKDSTAAASAKAVKDVIQTFQGNHGVDPASVTELRNGIPSSGSNLQPAVAKLPADITVQTAVLTGTSSEKTVRIFQCTGGYEIKYYKYSATAGEQTMQVGNPTSCPTTTSWAS